MAGSRYRSTSVESGELTPGGNEKRPKSPPNIAKKPKGNLSSMDLKGIGPFVDRDQQPKGKKTKREGTRPAPAKLPKDKIRERPAEWTTWTPGQKAAWTRKQNRLEAEREKAAAAKDEQKNKSVKAAAKPAATKPAATKPAASTSATKKTAAATTTAGSPLRKKGVAQVINTSKTTRSKSPPKKKPSKVTKSKAKAKALSPGLAKFRNASRYIDVLIDLVSDMHKDDVKAYNKITKTLITVQDDLDKLAKDERAKLGEEESLLSFDEEDENRDEEDEDEE